MSVKHEHPAYGKMAPKWQRCRDASDGRDALLERATQYIPRLKEQEQNAYDTYAFRATYFNATWRTIAGLTGLLFQKTPHVEVPSAVEPYLEDIDMAGEPLHVFAQECAVECMTVGRVGVMIDFPSVKTEGEIITVRRAEQAGLRPIMTRYTAESIINWRAARINNQHKLTMVVLREEAKVAGADEFEEKTEPRWRVLDLVLLEGAQAYRQRVFKHDEKTGRDILLEERFPLRNGKYLDEIPFIILGVDTCSHEVAEPPLIDLVDLNLAHYRVSADYEHGCHFTGLPTPWIAGYQPTDSTQKMYIGSSAAWGFQDPQTKVGFLEFTGQGMQTLERNLERKEQQMARLGARLLAQEAKVQETATVAMLQQNGETSILSSIAQVLSLGLTRALSIFSAWAGQESKVEFEINREFFPASMTPQMLHELVASWQAGAISKQTLFDQLQKAEIISEAIDFEEEQGRTDQEPPPRPATAQPMGGLRQPATQPPKV